MSLIKEQFTRFRKEKSLSEIRNTHTNKDQKEKETSLCASIILGKTKASYTLEAAVVFPIFISLMVTMMLLMRVLSIEYGMHQAMQESAREAAACKKYANYCNFYFLFDFKNLLQLKDSPIDKGKEIFEELMKNKVQVRLENDL